ncbi:MAG TPA: EscU/YscU/HrcU family type III secretion system export apparatus switch protein [Actinophytocola sp.]|uniref:EscU/YscU/HrcU family type III secretion system export apparatus switch protein n=1 Tax=Actinophytocola sp. TaxID=1872138 RepID=UPI002DBA579E|nr:EscU/YscU/HrcU family type III secretion system export apparatus switch protein [Actinophytocola sp.]HEU5474230.1 EscU/YscU/HrcU family type III secretion system export apparatus switch protein [Actinophytocola sp.]
MSKKDKTEKPTPKKLKEARREGRTARTPELGAWAAILTASFLIPGVLKALMDTGADLLRRIADFIARPDPGAAVAILADGLRGGALAVAPLLGAMVLAIIASAGVQGGLRPAPKLLKPQVKRLNPLSGFKRIVGPKAWWEGAKTLLKTLVLGAVLYFVVKGLIPAVTGSGSLPLAALIDITASQALNLIRTAAAVGLVLALVDYIVVRRRTNKELKMTKQEVRDEHKNTEGDPQLKGAIRSRQLSMSRNRMMSDIPTADVVLANPTHVAVALRYDPAKGAPRVVAKGAGPIAAKIRALATEHRVPIVRDVPLARALYKSCELGQEIPANLFAPVAHVLAFLHRLRRKGSAAGTHTLAQAS